MDLNCSACFRAEFTKYLIFIEFIVTIFAGSLRIGSRVTLELGLMRPSSGHFWPPSFSALPSSVVSGCFFLVDYRRSMRTTRCHRRQRCPYLTCVTFSSGNWSFCPWSSTGNLGAYVCSPSRSSTSFDCFYEVFYGTAKAYCRNCILS